MTFLGVLLIILGLILLFGVSFLIGLIVITVGVICISSASKRKAREEEERQRYTREQEQQRIHRYQEQENRNTAIQKEESKAIWIANRTQELMDEGLLPSDAKIKAETEYILNNQ